MSEALTTAVNVKFVVQPNHRETFLAELKKDADQTLATEPGNLQFVVGQDVSNENIFHLHEQYMTKEDYKFHQKTPHFLIFDAYLKKEEPLQEPPVVVDYQCQHTPAKLKPRPAYCLNVESNPKKEFVEEFTDLMKSHQHASLAEPLCMQFDYGTCKDEDGHKVWHQHEEFTGEREGLEGFEAHQQGQHFDKFMKFNRQDPYRKPQTVYFFKTIFLD